MPLPNFFIVGAPNAATPFLHACLDQHPQVYMSPLKEPNYFASELHPGNFGAAVHTQGTRTRGKHTLENYLRGDMREKRAGGLVTSWGDYLKLFDHVSHQVAIGEASFSYLWSQTAARNIASRVPHARIIINLRNPVDRAFSHYLHGLSAGSTNRTFHEEIEAALPPPLTPGCLRRSLLEFGQYYEQIKRYQNAFSRPQLHISLLEDLQRSPAALITDLLAFLGVDPDIKLDVSKSPLDLRTSGLNSLSFFLKKWLMWPYLRNLLPQPLGPRLRSVRLRSRASLVMDPADRAFLMDYYRDDIRKLSELLNRDLSSWLHPAQHDQLKTTSLRRTDDPRHPR